MFGESIGSGFGNKKVQPPMIVGKAKIPSDLQCVLNHHQIGRKNSISRASPKHKTIEHHRTSTSFVNASLVLNEYDSNGKTGNMSPLEINTGREQAGKLLSGRQTIN